jgi:hypothetical protein
MQRRPFGKNCQHSSSLENKLNAYTISAAAALVVLGTNPSTAEIIFTPANGHIANNQKLNIDLNHDGIPDFALINAPHFGPNSNSFGESFSVRPLSGNGAWIAKSVSYFAAALPSGVPVGSKATFHSMQLLMAFAERTDVAYFSGGAWKNAANRFLGLKVFINGEVHYGWARLTVSANEHHEEVDATLTGYAYETEPNTPIKTGKTSEDVRAATLVKPAGHSELTLGMLARGAQILMIGSKRIDIKMMTAKGMMNS